jgi:hypothetical protein
MKRVKITLAATIMFAITFTLNACGPSKAELAIMAMPSAGEVSGLKDKLIWLQGNAQSGGSYVLEIDADEKINCGGPLSSYCELLYKGKNNVTITLRGIGANRTINSYSTYNELLGSIIIGSGVTLILDDNITLKGETHEFTFVKIGSGGTLVMNDGSAIIGVTNKYNSPNSPKILGAGVYVDDGGTFIMKGGTISGNTIQPRPLTVQEVEQAKRAYAVGYSIGAGSKKGAEKAEEKFSNIGIRLGGAGVYVSGGVVESIYSTPGPFSKKPTPSGTFIKTGGTITGYSSDPENGNAVRDDKGNVLNGFGHAMSFGVPTYASEDKEPITIDTTIGPEITINFKDGVFSEGRNEP